VQYLAECGGAYWLIDEILLNQQRPKIKKEEFQVWELSRVKTSDGHTTTQAILTCTDGNGGLVWGEAIGFTDFPLLKVKLYFTDNVLLLPSEY
jgi:hypothetical protein